MATKKKTAKKAPVKTEVKKTTVKRSAPRRTTSKKTYKDVPGGMLMYVFLIIAAAAAIVAIAGIFLENSVVDTGNLSAYESFFNFIKSCRDVALGIFGIFLVLACFMKISSKK
jgi:hypothetical protein